MNYNFFYRLFIFTVLTVGSQSVQSQVVLYFEKMSDVTPQKIYAGQKISVKLKGYQEDWTTVKIERILKDENIILYDGGMFDLEDIIYIRMTRPWASTISVSMISFGTSWLVYGGIAHFAVGTFTFGLDTAVIGAGSIIGGWLIRKLFRWKKYKIGKKNRLKILDLSWPPPVGTSSSYP